MTVGQLIEHLALYAHESDSVFIWVDGNRYEIANVDDMGESIIDITAKVDNEVTE